MEIDNPPSPPLEKGRGEDYFLHNQVRRFGLGIWNLNQSAKRLEFMTLRHKFFKIHKDDLINYNFTLVYVCNMLIFNNNYFTQI